MFASASERDWNGMSLLNVLLDPSKSFDNQRKTKESGKKEVWYPGVVEALVGLEDPAKFDPSTADPNK